MAAKYSYRGTKITGTSAAGKVFKKSGIKNAKKGQKYFNKSTGHVYQCTEGGKASKAKWKYIRTDIAKKPTVAVSGLGAPARITIGTATRCMRATWKTPAAMVDTKKGDRATALKIEWFLGIAGKDPKKVVKTANEKLTESTIYLSSLTIGKKKYERKDFYPFDGKPKLNYVTVKVTSQNAKGSGASAKATREFIVPRKPTISSFEFDQETGEVSCTITTNPGNDYQERYDTRYKMTVYYSDTKETVTVHDTSTTLTSKTISFDDAQYASRNYEEFAKVTVTAWARGYKGNSAPAEKTFYISYPSQASIDDVQVSSKDSTGKCTIYVTTHSTEEHPVDRVKLEYLANSDYAEANLIPGDAGWEQTDIIDDATCKALAISVSNLIPDRGKYTWTRLKTFHANETVLYRYSQYWRIKDLETPAATAADDKIKILSAVAGADGRSAVIELVWDDGDLPSTGTELSWDEEEDAWKSTKEPNNYEFTWSDGARTIDGETWGGSATITIKGLDEASKYFVKARRYSEGDETTFSEYSNSATVVTSEKPESVTASADRYVPRGTGLNVYWTFAGNGLQKEWQIVDSNGTVLANGEGSLGSTQIPADRLMAFAEDGEIAFTVQVSTGSGFVVSEEKKVTIIEPPVLELTGNSLVHVHEEAEREFSGDIVTFEPREGENIKSLKVNLSPIQDLHGYGSPWVGGAGKNKLNEADFTSAQFSVSDGIFSNTVVDTRTSLALYARLFRSDGTFDTVTIGLVSTTGIKTVTFTASDDFVALGVLHSGSTANIFGRFNNCNIVAGRQYTFSLDVISTNPSVVGGFSFKHPQLEEGSTATSWTPWENICPIYGHDSVGAVVSPTQDAEDGTKYTADLPQTVYGWHGDMVTGEGEIDRVMETWTGNNVTSVSSDGGTQFARFVAGNRSTGATADIKCNQYKPAGTSVNGNVVWVSTGQQVVRAFDNRFTDLATAKALVDAQPIQYCYPLATTIPFNIDPQVISTLYGQNNVWSEQGDVELTLMEVLVDEDQLKTNDLSLTFKSNKICDIKLIVTSQGAVGQFPQGILRQTAGDTVHSDVYVPVWTESNGEFTTTINLPTALDFWDLGSYTVTAVGIDRQTGLKSNELSLSFPVSWAHQAPSIEPKEVYTLSTDITVVDDKNYYSYDSETQVYTVVETEGEENPQAEGWYEVTITTYVTLTPIDETDDTGFHHQAVQINLTPPPEAKEDDVYDIYRVTGDGAKLIGESFPQTYIATDEYAPFGEDLTNHYRIAVRTADGDVAFSDIEYVLEGEGIRLDWAEGFLEYPYGVSIGDAYKKDVDIRTHLNGGISGYWNQGIGRKGSLSTEAIKVLQQSDIDLTRQLGRYTGPVFVRTKEGTAFEADVQITDLSTKNKAIMSIAIDAEEIDLTEEFMLPTPFRLVEEGE